MTLVLSSSSGLPSTTQKFGPPNQIQLFNLPHQKNLLTLCMIHFFKNAILSKKIVMLHGKKKNPNMEDLNV